MSEEGQSNPLERIVGRQHDNVRIDYTNWRCERSFREIRPVNLWFGSTEWHTEPQWLLRAYDVEKRSYRDFAMKDIDGWEQMPPNAEFSGLGPTREI